MGTFCGMRHGRTEYNCRNKHYCAKDYILISLLLGLHTECCRICSLASILLTW